MTRTNAREIVVHLIFEMNFTEDTAEQLLKNTMEPDYYQSLASETDIYSERPDPKQLEYIQHAVAGIREKQEELDGYIGKYAINWSISRISKMARAIMQVAIYEVLYVDDVPMNSAINEAVEMTRKYESEEVVSFVNGILGSFAKDQEQK